MKKLLSTITKRELVNRIAERSNATRVVTKAVVQACFDEIIAELAKGNRLEFRDFGVFETVVHAARVAQNPNTLERVHVPAKQKVKFKMGRLMKLKLNGHSVEARRLLQESWSE